MKQELPVIKKIKGFLYRLFYKCSIRKRDPSFEDRVSQHLLFNSLNSVVSLCRKDPEAAAGLVVEMGTYLQKSLEHKAPLIPLAEELEHVLSYMNIQKARFSDRLNFVPEIEESLHCLIPPFTLQPVADNALRHGILKRSRGGTVGISVKTLPHSVVITVKDDGEGMTAEQLSSLLKRSNKCHSLYKITHTLKASGLDGLDINSSPGEGTTVRLELPLH